MNFIAIVKYTFTAVSAFFLLSFVYQGIEETRFQLTAVKVTGVVSGSGGPGGANPIYRWEFPKGTRHQQRSHTSSSGWNFMPGDSINLYVDPVHPENAQIAGFADQWFLPVFMGVFGAMFGVAGFGMIYYGIRKRKMMTQLLSRGAKVKARISGIEIDRSISMNGRSPFVVNAEAMIDGKVYLFNSDGIWYDPKPYLGREEVDVIYLPENPTKYFVDLSFLPKAAD